MTYDELFVQILKNATLSFVVNRVYHLEVYQTNETSMQFPCLLYNQRSHPRQGGEISGSSGFFIAEYEVVVVAQDSQTIRDVSQTLYDLHEEDANETNYELYAALGYQWLDVEDDQEGIEYAIELQDKGFKTATLCALYYHAELTNNARNSQ